MSHEQNTEFSSVECIVWLTTLSRRVVKLECRICHMHYFVKLNCWFLVLAVFVNVKSRASAKLCASLFSCEAWKLEGQLIIASVDVTPAFNSSFICVRPCSQFCSGLRGTESTCKVTLIYLVMYRRAARPSSLL